MTKELDRVLDAIQRVIALLPRLRRLLPRNAPPIPSSTADRFLQDDPMGQIFTLLEQQMRYYEKYVPLLPTELQDELEAATRALERAVRGIGARKKKTKRKPRPTP